MTLAKKLVLKKITLSNFATFSQEEINFDGHLNIIVGETGSGKSLIFDALHLIFGARADKSFVRAGCECAIIEASFESTDQEVLSYLNDLGYPVSEQNEIILKRVIYQTGSSKAFINFQQSKIQTLLDFSRMFVDVIGQFENQKLLSNQYQLTIIDTYAKHAQQLSTYQSTFRELSKLRTLKKELVSKQDSHEQRLDYIDFQLALINDLSPSQAEEVQLIKNKDSFLNFEENIKTLEVCTNLSSESEHSLIAQFSKVRKEIEKATTIFSTISPEELNTIESMLQELSYKISSTQLNDMNAEESLDDIIEKLDAYQKLKRKFGGSIESVIQVKNDFEVEKSKIQNHSDEIKSLDSKILKLEKDLMIKAKALHQSRLKVSKKVSKLITKQIQSLNMAGARFEVILEELPELTLSGLTHLSFHIETNKGEGMFPLSQIASGGELSRILLAIRQHITSGELISVFLFDEIDSGIGGETGLLIGQSLKSIAQKSQVIAISHLPQIAFQANQLVEISKKSQTISGKTRTFSEVAFYKSATKIKNVAKSMTPLN